MAGFLLLAPAASAFAACPDPAQAEAMVKKWEQAEPIRGLPAGLNMDEAVCMRNELVKALQRRLGRVIGYKAGLTSKAVQQRFGYDQPVRGVLLAGMLWPETRDPLPASFGARPVVEADLLVEVRDESINEARTHLDVLKALARVIPFIELPDLTIAEGEPVTGPIITAINVGARQGVFGLHPVPVVASQAFADMLAGMRVVVTDARRKDAVRQSGNGDPRTSVERGAVADRRFAPVGHPSQGRRHAEPGHILAAVTRACGDCRDCALYRLAGGSGSGREIQIVCCNDGRFAIGSHGRKRARAPKH